MNSLQVFSSQEFGQVRFMEYDGKPYAIGLDVAKVLGYEYPGQAVNRHCKGRVKTTVPSGGGQQETNVIPEGDIYRLIIRSKLKTAERFESWVFDEVLPTLRQKGTYSVQQMSPSSIPQIPQNYQEALRMLADSVDQNQRMLPKAKAFDTFMDSEDYQDIGTVAKALGTGRNRLFQLLRAKGILMGNGMPYQKYITQGYFVVKESTDVQTLVTTQGVAFVFLQLSALDTIDDIQTFLKLKCG